MVNALAPLGKILPHESIHSLHLRPSLGEVRMLLIVDQTLYLDEAFLEAYGMAHEIEEALRAESIEAWIGFIPKMDTLDYSAIASDYAISIYGLNQVAGA